MEVLSNSGIEEIVVQDEQFPTAKSAEISESIEHFSSMPEGEALKLLTSLPHASISEQIKMQKNLPLLLDRVDAEALVGALPELFARLQPNKSNSQLVVAEVLVRRIAKESYEESPKELGEICEALIDFLEPLLDPVATSLSQRACGVFVALGLAMPQELVDSKLLTSILNIFHEVEHDLLKINALNMLPRLHSRFSKELFEGFIATEIVALCQAPRPELRLAAYKAFFSLVEELESGFLQRKFLDVITFMNADFSNDVRVLFTSHISLIARKLPLKAFDESLAQGFIANLESKNRFVREEAISRLGELLITLSSLDSQGPAPTSFGQLYEKFFDLPRLLVKLPPIARPNACKSNCHLLSKMLLLRPEGAWERLRAFLIGITELEKASLEIAKLAIAAQLSVLSTLPPADKFSREFLPLLDGQFLTLSTSTSERVKLATLKQLSSVLIKLDASTRDRYADVFYEVMSADIKKWRIRYLVSQQIDQIAMLFTEETVQQKIIPLFFSFCKDPVATVRTVSAKMYASLFVVMPNDVCKLICAENFRQFAKYKQSFTMRKSAVQMFQSLFFKDQSLIEEEDWALLLELCEDAVTNVRIEVAIFLKEVFKAASPRLENIQTVAKKLHPSLDQRLEQIIRSLEERKDSDIYSILFEITGQEKFRYRLKPLTVFSFQKRKSQSSSGGSLHSSMDEDRVRGNSLEADQPTQEFRQTSTNLKKDQILSPINSASDESSNKKSEEFKLEESKSEEFKHEESKSEEFKHEESKPDQNALLDEAFDSGFELDHRTSTEEPSKPDFLEENQPSILAENTPNSESLPAKETEPTAEISSQPIEPETQLEDLEKKEVETHSEEKINSTQSDAITPRAGILEEKKELEVPSEPSPPQEDIKASEPLPTESHPQASPNQEEDLLSLEVTSKKEGEPKIENPQSESVKEQNDSS